MLEERASVVNVDQTGVWVATVKQSACAACSMKKGCGQKLLAKIGQGKTTVICVNNPDNLIVTEGNEVMIGIDENALVRISLLMYLLPLLALFLGAIFASILAWSELAIIASGLIGLGLGLLSARVFSRFWTSSYKYHPVLLHII